MSLSTRAFWKKVGAALKKSAVEFGRKELMLRSAALAYYTIFSLPPIILLLTQLSSVFYDPITIEQTIFSQFRELFGRQTASQLADTVSSIGLFEREGWSLIVGVGGTLFTATTIFVTIQGSLNKIFEAEAFVEKLGWWQLIKGRLIALALLLSIAFVLVVTLIANALITRFTGQIQEIVPALSSVLLYLFAMGLPVVVVGFLFVLIFRYLPDRPISWRDASVGALVTTLLFFIGQYAISFYLGLVQPGNIYDAAGSLVVIMVWIFYASAIFYFGAQFTYSYNDPATVESNPSINTKE
ncbi:MAG: YihY/virulence factor BrkB family protein [Bacteroidota bacterium]